MAGIARIGDTASGTCSSHKTVQSVTGTITTGADYSEADGIKIAVLGSQVGPGSGNITATITSCSPNSTAI